jgi:hypothetical protein
VVAFAGVYPAAELVKISLIEWGAKTLYEALATPVTYLVVGFLKAREGVDVYDTDTRFNPFLVWGVATSAGATPNRCTSRRFLAPLCACDSGAPAPRPTAQELRLPTATSVRIFRMAFQ